jgi:hypothetical protein
MGIVRFPDAYSLLDPRNLEPSNEHIRALLAWQIMAITADVVNVADANGCPINEVAIEDALWKFGLNYVLRPSSYYEWFHPTYVNQYLKQVAVQVAGCLGSNASVPANVAEYLDRTPATSSGPPPDPYPTSTTAGLLTYTPGHYPALSQYQCALLARAEAAHMNDTSDIQATQLDFEKSAKNIAQEQEFLLFWNGKVSSGNPPEVNAGLTRGLHAAHKGWTDSFHCATGDKPDMKIGETFALQHAQLHWCRATSHFLDIPIRTVCFDHPIDECPHLTCRQMAALY